MPPSRIAVVTGGGTGIGRASAVQLARAGLTVTVLGRRTAPLEETVEMIQAAGGDAGYLQCDVTDEGQVMGAFNSMGEVDALVCCAGAATSATLGRTTAEQWRTMIDLNATSAFLCMRQVIPAMVERGHGRVVVVASISGVSGHGYISAYTAAKHAAVGLMRSVASEVATTNVTVNAVCPAYVDTSMTSASVERIATSTGRRADTVREHLGKSNALGRLLHADEVAAAVTYLCSDLAGAVTGQALVLGG